MYKDIIQENDNCRATYKDAYIKRLAKQSYAMFKAVRLMFLDLHKDAGKNPLDSMPWDLLRSIAIIQLYLEERWVEPFEQKKKPFRLLLKNYATVQKKEELAWICSL